MRKRRIVAGVIVVCVVAVVTLLLWPERTKIEPPAVSVAKIESAGVDDDEGKEMWLVTLSIRNPNNARFADEGIYTKKSLYVEDGAPIEFRVTNSWVAIKGGLGCYMSPGDKHETAFAVPAGANACRVFLKYTHGVMYRRSAGLAMRLPHYLRSRIPNGLWQWLGYARHRPSSNWQEINIVVPFPLPAMPLTKVGEKGEGSSSIDAAK
jgi:hypothetical protein